MPLLPISTFSSRTDAVPLGAELDWPGDLNEWRELVKKDDAPLWSPVTYREGGRRRKGGTSFDILSVHAIVLDCDGGATIAAATAAWAGFEHAIYSSYGHELVKPPKYKGEPRFRLILPLTRAITVEEHASVWAWAQAFSRERGALVDGSACDPGRMYYVPTHRPGAPGVYRYTPGEPVSPDAVLTVMGTSLVRPRAPGAFDPSLRIPTPIATSGAPETGIFAGIALAHQTEHLDRIEAQCPFVRHAREDAEILSEPEWYAWLSIVVRCRDGDALAHDIGSAHPGYSRDETDAKLQRALADTGPFTCARIRELGSACAGCALGQPVGPITSPVQLGRLDPETATPEEVREDTAARGEASQQRAREGLDAARSALATRVVEEARLRATLAQVKAFGTGEAVLEAAHEHATSKVRLAALRETFRSAEKILAAAERDAARVQRLDKADPRVLADPRFALDVKTGMPQATLSNVSLILETDASYAEGKHFAWNLFDRKLYYGPDGAREPAADHVDSAITIDIQRRYAVLAKTLITQEAILEIAHRHAFDPVRTYLDSLVWDGVPRLGDLFREGFEGVGAPAPYLTEAGRKFGIGCVARIYEPGCKLDTMIVLTGAQGVGKSSGLRALVGPAWFSDSTLPLGDKDAYLLLNGRWVFEIPELDSFRRADQERIKAFLTSQEDSYRPPFGRHPVKVPRITIFVGTTNEAQFLNDPTGSRRFVPISVVAVHLAWILAHRDQLWAEAVAAYRSGEVWYYAGESALRLAEASAPYQQDDPWEPLIADWLARQGKATVTTIDALTGAIGLAAPQIDRRTRTRMGGVLRALRCVEEREERADGTRPRVWSVPEALCAKGPAKVLAFAGGGRGTA